MIFVTSRCVDILASVQLWAGHTSLEFWKQLCFLLFMGFFCFFEKSKAIQITISQCFLSGAPSDDLLVTSVSICRGFCNLAHGPFLPIFPEY